MNRSVLARQMFAKGGQAVPNEYKGFSMLPEEVQMKMDPVAAKKYAEGGIAGMMPPEMSAPPAMPAAPPPMEGGQAIDPQLLESALAAAEQEITNLDQAEDFETVMNTIRGDEATVEERYEELASVVGEEDARQTPESVLTLVQPAMVMGAVDQGIGGLAQQQMMEPVQGAMAQGIMSTVEPPQPTGGMGGPPPVNFKEGGLVRRGDNQPVLKFQNAGLVPYLGPRVGMTPADSQALRQQIDVANLKSQLAAAQSAPTVRPLKEIFDETRGTYASLLGGADKRAKDLEEQRNLTKAQMLFDVANTALAFAAPMQGETPGMSAAERLAMAARTTQLPQTIGARAQAQKEAERAMDQEERALDLAALKSAEETRTAEAAARSKFRQKQMELDAKTTTLGPDDILVNSKGDTIAEGAGSTVNVSPNSIIMNKKTGKILGKGVNTQTINGIPIETFNKLDQKGKDLILFGNPSVNGVPASIFTQLSSDDQKIILGTDAEAVKGIPRAIYNGLSEDDQRKVLLGAQSDERMIKNIPESVFNKLPKVLQTQILGGLVTTSKGQTVTDVTTKEVVAEGKTDPILKVIDNQLVLFNEQTKKAEPIFGKPKPPTFKGVKITRNDGTETIVNANTEAGMNAIKQANADNAANPGTVNVVNLGTEARPKPKAFLIPGTGVVTSYDGGQTYTTASGATEQMPQGPGASFPLSDTISYDIYRRESIRQEARDRLGAADDAMTTALTRPDGSIAPSTDQTMVRNALLAARNATGPWANFSALIDGVVAGTVPSDTIRNLFQDTQDNRQFIRALKILGSSALSVSPRMAVYDLARVERLFPDPDAFFRNPVSEANKLVVLKQIVVQQKTRNDQALAAGIDDATLQSEVIRKNFEIDRLLSLLESVDASGGGLDQSVMNQIMQDVQGQRNF